MSTVAVGRRTTPSTALQTYRTLVVDDVADLRQLYRRILERTGRFEIVGEAGDGNEALELAGRLQPDLVMLDVSMPDRDGMEILPDILHHAPGATVVMVSGFEARRLEPLALERGAVAYLEKGITLERLVGELLRALGSDPEGTVVPRSGRRSPRETHRRPGHHPRGAAVLRRPRDPQPPLRRARVRRHPGARCRGARARRDPPPLRTDRRERALPRRDRLQRPAAAGHLPGRPAPRASDPRSRGADPRPRRAVGDRGAGRAPRAAHRSGPAVHGRGPRPVPAGPDQPRRQRSQALPGRRHGPHRGRPRRPHVVVAVQDEGPGIPEADRERVFERFVRLDRGATGIGLGLYISRALVEAMDGTIAVEDGPVGARLAVRLPVHEPGSPAS